MNRLHYRDSYGTLRPMTCTTTKGHAMNGKAFLAAIATAAAGLAAALAMTAAPSAHAATVDDLSNLGYSVTVTNLCSGFPCVANGCHDYAASGYGVTADIGSDCDASFQSNLDTFVAGHPERKLGYEHPAAVAARGDLQTKGYAVSTDYTAPTFHITGGCNVDSVADAASIVTLDQALPAAAPCPPPPPTGTDPTTTTGGAGGFASPPPGGVTDTTTTVTVTVSDPDLTARVAALEKEYADLAARVNAIAQANTAAWTAFIDASNAGASPADAALAARSAGMNAIYQLPA